MPTHHVAKDFLFKFCFFCDIAFFTSTIDRGDFRPLNISRYEISFLKKTICFLEKIDRKLEFLKITIVGHIWQQYIIYL